MGHALKNAENKIPFQRSVNGANEREKLFFGFEW